MSKKIKTLFRVTGKCRECGKQFTYLPRRDGKPQREECYKCVPRPKFVKPLPASK